MNVIYFTLFFWTCSQ